MKRLFIFDMDGTLLPKTTGLIEVARVTGHLKELQELEKAYFEKKIDNEGFALACRQLWNDLTHEHVKTAFFNSPKLNNISEVLQEIQHNGNFSCLITAAPHFYAEHFNGIGFNRVVAAKPYDISTKKFDIKGVLSGRDKPMIAERICDEFGLNFENSVAFGDSISDVPLFTALNHTISVNGDEHLKAVAKHFYEGDDLMQAYNLFKT